MSIARTAALLLTALPAFSSQELPPDVLTLAHAMNTNRDFLKRLPLYTCLQTIQRSTARSHARASALDVVQVDVGASPGTEMYSWPDETTFSSLDLPDLVAHGLLSTGMFSGFAHNLFVGDQAIVQLIGEDSISGRQAIRFKYRVPSLMNRWNINWKGRLGQLQEAGQFWVSAPDYHLIRLQVDAQNIPPQLLLRSIALVMDYQTIHDHSSDSLLPIGGTFTVVDNSGTVYRNTVAFSHCHVFAAESKMAADDPDPAAVFTRYKQAEGFLPAGLTLKLALLNPIDATTARVGDSITARLESTVRSSTDFEILKGAVFNGRVRQFEKLNDPPNTYLVEISFSGVECGDRNYRFFAELLGMESLPGIHSARTHNQQTMNFHSEHGGTGIVHNESTISYSIPGAAVFFLSDTPSLPKGFSTSWRTTQAPRH